jgi:ATP-dependent Lhr-like helicase
LREDLPWLLASERADLSRCASGAAQEVLNALRARGALFFQDLKALTGLLPTQLEDALRELAAMGLVSSDTFAAVRSISAGASKARSALRRYGRTQVHRPNSPVGRWSLFPGPVEAPDHESIIDRWCRQLLSRYGVLFRDLLAREASAPPWRDLVGRLRRLELRGEVRGGRFIRGVVGEQFALESAVGRLRDLRDRGPSDEWALICAADPTNVAGVITPGPRIPATHKNALIVQNGRCVAAKVAGRIEFFTEIAQTSQMVMRKSLQMGRKVRVVHPVVPEPHAPFGPVHRPRQLDPTQLHSRRRMGF